MHIPAKLTRYSIPWSRRRPLLQMCWELVWFLSCVWTPKPFNPWRLLVLRLFGATVYGCPFVHQRARVDHPWNLTLHHRACLGDRAHAYCLGEVEVGPGACVAQEAYLCSGTHDFSAHHWPLATRPISIGADVFIGARAFVLPGVTIGNGVVVGACSVVTRSIDPFQIVAGNPARPVRSVW